MSNTEDATLDKALANARKAIQCHVEGLASDGLPVPDEQARLHLSWRRLSYNSVPQR